MDAATLERYRKLRIEVLDEYHTLTGLLYEAESKGFDGRDILSSQLDRLRLLVDRSFADEMAGSINSYQDFIALEEAGHLREFVAGHANAAQASATLAITYQLARWRYYGRSCYVVTEALAESLVRAKLGKIPSSYFQLPMPSFYIQFESNAGCFLYDPVTGEHPLVGALVTETQEGSDRVLRISLMADPNENSTSPIDDAFYYISFILDPESTMTQILERQTDIVEMNKAVWQFSHDISGEVYRQIVKRASKLVVNTILYIISERSDLSREVSPLPALERQFEQDLARKSPKKRKKLERRYQKQLERVTGVDRVVVGRNLQKPASRSGSGGTSSGRRSPRWHMVEYHIKLQAYGKGRKLRKVVAIMPYARGNPELGRVEKTIVEHL